MKRARVAVPAIVATDHDPQQGAALYRFLIESLTEFAVFAVSPGGDVISWNAGAQHTFGYTEAEIVGRNFSVIFSPEDIAAGAPAAELATALSGEQPDHDRWHVRKNGTRFWGTNTVQPIFDRSGTLLGFAKLVRDITANHLALEALGDSEERLRLLIESVTEYAIFSLALDGSVTSWNVGAQATFGYTEAEIMGRPCSVFFTDDDIAAGVPAAQLQQAQEHGRSTDERWLVRKDGTRFLSGGKVSQLKRRSDGNLRGFVMIAHDVTEVKRISEEMRRRALSDQLTELPNRTAFYEHLSRAIALAKRRSSNMFAVLFIDLDHFKNVNDTYGHVIADRLLELTARRLERCVRSEDVIARLGGDEFAILLNGISGLADATDAGDRIGIAMSLPVTIEQHQLTITASVGIALGSSHYEHPQDIVQDADVAMYRAKTRGRARAVVYGPELDAAASRTLDIGNDLRSAIVRGELRTVYQPIVNLTSFSIAGFEALVRWQHPRRGLLEPADFIPHAESSDAIIPIDRWVLRAACEQLAVWQREGHPTVPLQMSVNFSSRQFSHPDLAAELRATVAAAGLEPHAVRIEITEGVMIEQSANVLDRLAEIRAFGIEVDVDDFGVGYSSLAVLGSMPVSALKIDRSFVTNMTTEIGRALVRTIVNLAHTLGLIAVAEGVETPEQLALLIEFECDLAQGYFFSAPLDAAAAGLLLDRPLLKVS